ncbi:vacuolar protein sorting-associated protein 1 [Nematocida sp. AWRm77]|nr:vacuolar protein sorting-associated protein 1 [Nematocida sp. AWRm77]
MKDLIEKVNALQELCADIPNAVNLPQIVVVGAQSSGKSSILENIVGADFLPRGAGMVTKRPLLIQILPLPPAEESAGSYCVFGHAPGKRFELESVRSEIETETDRILSAKDDVSAIPIVLKMHMQGALPLTLIDLPGIIKVKSEGQPEGIVKKIEEISRTYVRNPNTVILAVTPAVTDISSSDGLMLAKEADPQFERTLCVLTKVDLMDPGTDLLPVLQGKLVSVKLGFVPVICRGELSIRENTSIEHALSREEAFFRAHPVYGSSTPQHCGVKHLVGRLHGILHESIQKNTPYLQARVESLLEVTQKKVHDLGVPVSDPKQQMMQLITEFRQELDARISGTLSQHTRHSSREILNGARISYSLDTVFARYIRQLDLFSASDEEVETVILNASGVFGAPNSFQGLAHFISFAIDKLKPTCLNTALSIQSEMHTIVEGILARPQLARFPKLRKQMSKCVQALLKERSASAAQHIQHFLHWNSVYVKKPEQIYRLVHSPETFSASAQKKDGPLESAVGSLREEISLYMAYVKEVVIEQVPKIIVLEVVHEFLSRVQGRLIEDLYLPEDTEHLLEEESAVSEKRKALLRSLSSLQKAHCITKEL